MSEKNKQNAAEIEKARELENALDNQTEFTLGEFKIDSISSAGNAGSQPVSAEAKNARTAFSTAADAPQMPIEIEPSENSKKLKNPVFRELAEPKLPRLKRENRARLQMQTPTRVFFYWSLKENPFETLHRIFGGAVKNYTLAVKLINRKNSREEVFPIAAEGSWWFDVDTDSVYAAEIGFYAANRPFVRLMFSNSVETPRLNPSPRPAADSDWAVSADSFARVLDNSGFTQDAFTVALAGDDPELAETATQAAFEHFFGAAENDFAAHDSGEMRFALLALASGYSLENLRGQISPTLFDKLRENPENLKAEKALAALQENFGVFTGETVEAEESPAATVFGASLINFPRGSKQFFRQNALPKLSPVSSL